MKQIIFYEKLIFYNIITILPSIMHNSHRHQTSKKRSGRRSIRRNKYGGMTPKEKLEQEISILDRQWSDYEVSAAEQMHGMATIMRAQQLYLAKRKALSDRIAAIEKKEEQNGGVKKRNEKSRRRH